MPIPSPDRESRNEKAFSGMRWVSEISAGGFMLGLPCWGGYWLDGQFGTSPWCLVVGGFLGLISSFLHILTITGVLKSVPKRK